MYTSMNMSNNISNRLMCEKIKNNSAMFFQKSFRYTYKNLNVFLHTFLQRYEKYTSQILFA